MAKRVVLILLLGWAPTALQAEDFVNTFNHFQGHLKLAQEDGIWSIRVSPTWEEAVTYPTATINVLDLKNFYIDFTLNYPAGTTGPWGTTGDRLVFATYPKLGDGDVVAESGAVDFAFYKFEKGAWKYAEVFPPDTYLRFFDPAYLAQHPKDLPMETSSRYPIPSVHLNSGLAVLTYRLVIPQFGTKTLLTLEATNSEDYPKRIYDLVAALRFHTVELLWDKKKGKFNIVKVY